MTPETELQPEGQAEAPSGEGLVSPPCSTIRVKMEWRSVETHTITREIPASKVTEFERDADFHEWLQNEFQDDDFADSDICTDDFHLDRAETLPSNDQSDHGCSRKS